MEPVTHHPDPRELHTQTEETADVGAHLLHVGWVVQGIGSTRLRVSRTAFDPDTATVDLTNQHHLTAALDGTRCDTDSLSELHHWLNQHLPVRRAGDAA